MEIQKRLLLTIPLAKASSPVRFVTLPRVTASSRQTDTARRGIIPAGLEFGECALRVLEADVSTFNLGAARGILEDAHDAWDGIIICYDVTEEESLLHVEDLLRECAARVGITHDAYSFKQKRSAIGTYRVLWWPASPNWRKE